MRLGLLVLLAACGAHRELDIRHARAAELVEEGRLVEAREVFLDLYAVGYRPAALGLGIVLREEGDLEGSLTCLQEVGPCEDLAFTLHALGRHREAAGVFGLLLTDDPLSLYNLGAALHDAGEPVESLWREAASRTPPHDELWEYLLLGLAKCCRARGDSEQADGLARQVEDIQQRADPWPK